MLRQQLVGYFSHKNFTKLYTELFFTSGSPTQEIILGRDVVLENQSALIKKKLFISLSTSLTNNKVLVAYRN